MSLTLGNHSSPLHGLGILPSTQRCQSVSCWPIIVPYSPGHNDWFRVGHTSQAGPVRVFIGIPVWASGKEVLLPLALVNQEFVSPKCCVAILSTMWREPVWEWSQEEAIRSEGWREGTDLIISLLYWTYQPRLALSHTENPLLDWWLVMNSIQNQLHLLLTWFELDICHLHIPQNITYVPGKWLGTILSWSLLIHTASTGMREHCPHFTDREYHSHFTEVQRAVRTHPCSHE